VRQTFFLAEAEVRGDVELTLVELCGETRPVTTYILQPPAEGEPVGAELWAFPPGAVSVQSKHTAVAALGGLTWGFVGGLETGAEDGPHAGICRLLGLAQRELQHSGLQFRQVVRTWYYVGDILGPAADGTRYHEANRARNEFYPGKWPDLRQTPASTGIGMKGRDVAFEGLAVADNPDARRVVWIDNPLQTPPCDYAPPGDQKASPSFSRAAAVMLPACTVVFVSGTASIRASDVVAAGDARSQTQVTIENIATVLSSDNLVGRHGLPRGGTLQDFQQFRVYVKRADDLAVVREACQRLLPPVPSAYLLADVCRPECLVEIEGVAAFHV
jgi:enamine deaminase RidA (YjgF/YER057c/UK114 family)